MGEYYVQEENALARESQRPSIGGKRQRTARQRNRAVAAQDAGVDTLECHRRAGRSGACEGRARGESLSGESERPAAGIAVCARGEPAVSERDGVAGACWCGLFGLAGKLDRGQLP